MNKNISIFALSFLVLFFLVFYGISEITQKSNNSTKVEKESNFGNIEITNKLKNKQEMMEQGIYTDYSEELFKNASGKIVLFFHADWCPNCVAFDKKVKTEIIPGDLTLLKVDYDNNVELRKKYNVLTQTTFVQVDEEGSLIKSWIGGRGIDSVMNKIN